MIKWQIYRLKNLNKMISVDRLVNGNTNELNNSLKSYYLKIYF